MTDPFISVFEISSAAVFLFRTLSSDESLSSLVTGVHQDVLPVDAVLPSVVFQYTTSRDINGLPVNARLAVEAQFQVKVIGTEAHLALLDEAAARIDVLLNAAEGQVEATGYQSEVNIQSSHRVAAFRLPPERREDGTLIYSQGARYSLFLTANN